MDKYEIQLTLTATKNGEPFTTTTHVSNDARYETVVVFQDGLVGMMDKLVSVGYAEAAKKGADPGEGQMVHGLLRGKDK